MLMRQTLDYVFSNAEKNNPKSILQTIDNFVLESGQFLMNVGPEKGEILRDHLLKSKPNNVIELGTFIGYSAVLISSTIGEKSKLTSIDSDSHSIEIAKELINFAGLDDKVNLMHGSAEEIIPELNFNADFVFIDHAKKKYLSDLKLLETEEIMLKNCTVFADNVGIFKDEMAEYFDHVRNSGKYQSQNFSSKLEYRNNIYDAVEISIKN
ncbi:class I SAM-dependent methyltransferase [Pelagibacteraceae bacterium]|nr:class I SAM-dependent methyltransferase [Pelagibacteraceae bacterium]